MRPPNISKKLKITITTDRGGCHALAANWTVMAAFAFSSVAGAANGGLCPQSVGPERDGKVNERGIIARWWAEERVRQARGA